MLEKYGYTLAWTGLTVAFILLSSLGVGALARWIVKLRGGSRQKQQNTFAGYLFASPWIVGFFNLCNYSGGSFIVLEFYHL